MSLEDYLRLADDGCPNCPEHVAEVDDEPPTIYDIIRRGMENGWRIIKLKMRWGNYESTN